LAPGVGCPRCRGSPSRRCLGSSSARGDVSRPPPPTRCARSPRPRAHDPLRSPPGRGRALARGGCARVPGGPFEPETTTTRDVEGGEPDWTAGGEEAAAADEGGEGGAGCDELTDAARSEVPDEGRSVRSSHSARAGRRSESVHEAEETEEAEEAGSAGRDLGDIVVEQEGNPAPLGPFKERPRSRNQEALPLGLEASFRRLKEKLWGKQGVHRNTRKSVRKEWSAKVRHRVLHHATPTLQEVQTPRTPSCAQISRTTCRVC